METTKAKTPVISKNTKLLCFDIESNGLHGEAFAVAAVVMNADGKVLDKFESRVKITGQVDSWVEKNVLPAIKDMPITHGSYKALREAFWRWYLAAEKQADYVLVSNGYPVEYRFLLQCQEADLEERYWQHPFPIIDLFSLLLLVEGLGGKGRLIDDIIREGNFKRHDPLDDAKITALVAFRAFGISGKLN